MVPSVSRRQPSNGGQRFIARSLATLVLAAVLLVVIGLALVEYAPPRVAHVPKQENAAIAKPVAVQKVSAPVAKIERLPIEPRLGRRFCNYWGYQEWLTPDHGRQSVLDKQGRVVPCIGDPAL